MSQNRQGIGGERCGRVAAGSRRRRRRRRIVFELVLVRLQVWFGA